MDNQKKELEDKVKGLTDTLSEYESKESPSETVIMLRDRMKTLRKNHAAEKRRQVLKVLRGFEHFRRYLPQRLIYRSFFTD